MFAVGDGVLRRRLGDGPDQEHQGQLAEGGVDGVHLPGDSQGKRPEPQQVTSSIYLKNELTIQISNFNSTVLIG